MSLNGPLFFADANDFRNSVLAMVHRNDPHTVVIDLDAATTMDIDGVEILIKIIGELGRQNIKVLLARVDSDNMELFERIGAMEEIGQENIFGTVRAAVAAAEQPEEPVGEEVSEQPDSPESSEEN